MQWFWQAFTAIGVVFTTCAGRQGQGRKGFAWHSGIAVAMWPNVDDHYFPKVITPKSQSIKSSVYETLVRVNWWLELSQHPKDMENIQNSTSSWSSFESWISSYQMASWVCQSSHEPFHSETCPCPTLLPRASCPSHWKPNWEPWCSSELGLWRCWI